MPHSLKIILPVVLAGTLASTAVWATTEQAKPDGAHVCLRARDIEHTNSKDGKTLMFRMRDGKVWRNTLRAPCNDLKFGGYTEVVRGDTICANQQLIQTHISGATCRLGDFSLVTEADAAN